MSLKKMYPQQKQTQLKSGAANVVTNNAGGVAYENSAEWRLVKLLTTGMLSDTFYVDAKSVNDELLKLAKEVSPTFLAQTLVYGRQRSYMRSNPIQLLALLSTVDSKLFRRVFNEVLKTGKDALAFATVIMSGQVRKEFGTAPREEMRKFLNDMDAYQWIKYGSAGQNPSLKDLIRIVHPKPKNEETDHLFKWVLDKRDKAGNPTWEVSKLPAKVQEYIYFVQLATQDGNYTTLSADEVKSERLRLLATGHLPHEVVTTYKLSPEEWMVLAQNMPYMATLRNLNTMARQGVFEDSKALKAIADKLGNEELVAKSKQFPYRFLSAYTAAQANIPQSIKTALAKALDVATRNVPQIDGQVVVAPDVSGSMTMAVSNKSQVRAIDVAGLVTSAVLRKNPDAVILPFGDRIVNASNLDANDTVLTNTRKLASMNGGGTRVSLPFDHVLKNSKLASSVKLFIAITDNESWADRWNPGQSETMRLWKEIRKNNPEAQALLINAVPYTSDQFAEGTPGVTMVSGFSDDIFTLMGIVAEGGVDAQLAAIKAISLD